MNELQWMNYQLEKESSDGYPKEILSQETNIISRRSGNKNTDWRKKLMCRAGYLLFLQNFIHNWTRLGANPRPLTYQSSHSIDISTEELKILRSLEPHSFLPQYPVRLASTSTKQPTSYTHTWIDTLIMKYQRRNSATTGQSSHNAYTRALNEILFTTEHVWARTHDLWHTSQSLYRHTHRGAKNIWCAGLILQWYWNLISKLW